MKIPALLLVLVAIIFTACGKVEDPEFRKVEDFRLKNIGLSSATVGFSATYFNPNDFGVSVKEAELDVHIDSVFMGTFRQPRLVEVKDNQLFSIPLEGTVDISKVIKMDFEKLLGREVLLQANGKVKIGKGGVYITKDINYSGRQRITSDLIKNPAAAGSY